MKKVRINPSLIKRVIESEDTLTFSYFIKLKYSYSNSTIYSYSIRKLSKLLKVSPNCIKSHLKKMERMNFIVITKNKNKGENITFISMEKVCKIYDVNYSTRGGGIQFRPNESVQDIKTKLYSRVLYNNLNKQKFSVKKKSDSLMRKKQQAEKLKRAGAPNHVLRSLASERINFDVFLCCETIGNMFGGTKMTGYNQLNRMVSMGLFKIKRKTLTILRETTQSEFDRLCNKGELIKGKYFYKTSTKSIIKNVGFSISVV